MITIKDQNNLAIWSKNGDRYEVHMNTSHLPMIDVSISCKDCYSLVTCLERNDIQLLIAWLECRIRDMENK